MTVVPMMAIPTINLETSLHDEIKVKILRRVAQNESLYISLKGHTRVMMSCCVRPVVSVHFLDFTYEVK